MGCAGWESIEIQAHSSAKDNSSDERKNLIPKKEVIKIYRRTNCQIEVIKNKNITKYLLQHLHENKKLDLIKYTNLYMDTQDLVEVKIMEVVQLKEEIKKQKILA